MHLVVNPHLNRVCTVSYTHLLEYKAQQMASDALQQGKTYTWEFMLHPNEVADLGMVCGGDVEVYFQYLSWQAPETAALLEHCLLYTS